MTPTKSTPKKITEGPLDILVSARIRLSKEEREALKAAYNAAKRAEVDVAPAPIGGSPIKTISANLSNTRLDQELGMSSLVMNDILSSRDSLNAPLVVHLQRVLGVEIITEKRLLEAAKSYISHILGK